MEQLQSQLRGCSSREQVEKAFTDFDVVDIQERRKVLDDIMGQPRDLLLSRNWAGSTVSA